MDRTPCPQCNSEVFISGESTIVDMGRRACLQCAHTFCVEPSPKLNFDLLADNTKMALLQAAASYSHVPSQDNIDTLHRVLQSIENERLRQPVTTVAYEVHYRVVEDGQPIDKMEVLDDLSHAYAKYDRLLDGIKYHMAPSLASVGNVFEVITKRRKLL